MALTVQDLCFLFFLFVQVEIKRALPRGAPQDRGGGGGGRGGPVVRGGDRGGYNGGGGSGYDNYGGRGGGGSGKI